MFGLFAGVYYWWPKVTGRLLFERLGQLALLALRPRHEPDLHPAVRARLRRHAAAGRRLPARRRLGGLNALSTVGAVVIALSVLVFLVNVGCRAIAGAPAGADPWEGQTLEWATTSPPPRHNFAAALPAIRSYAPLLDLREEAIL